MVAQFETPGEKNMWLKRIRRTTETVLAGMPVAEIVWAVISIGSFAVLLCCLAC
jgi:hypothetical protein